MRDEKLQKKIIELTVNHIKNSTMYHNHNGLWTEKICSEITDYDRSIINKNISLMVDKFYIKADCPYDQSQDWVIYKVFDAGYDFLENKSKIDDFSIQEKKGIEKHPITYSILISFFIGFILLFSFWKKIIDQIEALF